MKMTTFQQISFTILELIFDSVLYLHFKFSSLQSHCDALATDAHYSNNSRVSFYSSGFIILLPEVHISSAFNYYRVNIERIIKSKIQRDKDKSRKYIVNAKQKKIMTHDIC